MTWKTLARTALLGTEHHSLDEATKQKLVDEGLDISQSEPLLLAEAAALFGQMRKAGFPLEKFTGELPEALTATEEPTCSFRSAEHLRLILDGKYGPALPEFMAHLLESGLCLPTEHLPTLLQRSDLNEWWHLLEPALGQRGRWLLRQHPQWKKLVENADELSWETGAKEERLRLLRYLRQQNPALAIELLESTWETENYRDKAAFLGELSLGLSSTVDEVFLENARLDRRKEVRRKATELLTLLPDTNFGEAMFNRAKAMLKWHRGKIEVTIPDEPDEAAVADGILKIHLDWKGGAKAGHLGQVVSAVPPSLWEITWDRTPEEILEKMEATDWAETLLLAVAIAAVRYEDAAWTELLLRYWFEDESSPLWEEAIGGQILETASGQAVHVLAVDFLEKNKGLPGEDTPLFQFFLQNESPWENELTMLIVSRFRTWLRETKQQSWGTFHYGELLKMLAYRCSPTLFEELKKGWDDRAPLWAFWEKPIGEMIDVVFFRREVGAEMER